MTIENSSANEALSNNCSSKLVVYLIHLDFSAHPAFKSFCVTETPTVTSRISRPFLSWTRIFFLASALETPARKFGRGNSTIEKVVPTIQMSESRPSYRASEKGLEIASKYEIEAKTKHFKQPNRYSRWRLIRMQVETTLNERVTNGLRAQFNEVRVDTILS